LQELKRVDAKLSDLTQMGAMMDDKNLNISISARYCKNSPKKDTPRPEGAKQQVKMSNPTRSSPRKEEPDVKKIINVDCSWCE